MATQFTGSSLFVRFIAALIIVFFTYNPSGYSYLHWLLHAGSTNLAFLVLVGVILLICWVIFLRTTMRSLDTIGIILAVAFFACLIWLAVDFNLVSVASQFFVYLLLIAFAAILSLGLSWSHIRRRLTGQLDVDELDE